METEISWKCKEVDLSHTQTAGILDVTIVKILQREPHKPLIWSESLKCTFTWATEFPLKGIPVHIKGLEISISYFCQMQVCFKRTLETSEGFLHSEII